MCSSRVRVLARQARGRVRILARQGKSAGCIYEKAGVYALKQVHISSPNWAMRRHSAPQHHKASAQATPPQFGVDWRLCLLHAVVGVVVGLEQRRTLGRDLFRRRPQCEPHASRRLRVRCTVPCTSICHAAGNLLLDGLFPSVFLKISTPRQQTVC